MPLRYFPINISNPQFISDLRNLILSKGEKKTVKAPASRQSSEGPSRKTSEPNARSQPPSRQTAERQQPELEPSLVESQLKILKSKLSSYSSVFESGEDVDDWINDREFEILKLENELNVLTPNYENITFKLREINQLKTDLRTIREKFNKSKSPSRTSSIAKSIPSMQEQSKPILSKDYQTSPSNTPLIHSRSVSSISTNSGLGQRVALKRVSRDGSNTRTLAKHETPKFERDTVIRSSASSLLNTKLDLNTGNLKDYLRPSSPKRVTFKDSKLESQSFEQKNTYTRPEKPLFKSKSMSTKDYRSLNKSEPSIGIDPEEAIKESERLRALKTKNFNVLDDDEEFVVTGKVDDCKRDKLAKQYKALYYKSRELRQLLTEISDNNNILKLNLTEIDAEKRQILLDNEKLREEISEIEDKFAKKEREYQETQRDLEAKLAELDEDNYQLSKGMDEARRQNEVISARLAPYSGRGDLGSKSDRGGLNALDVSQNYSHNFIGIRKNCQL